MKQIKEYCENMSIKIPEKVFRHDNNIVENLSRQQDLKNKTLSRDLIYTGTTYLNIESSLKSISDRVDVLTSLDEGLVSTPVVNRQSTVSFDFSRLVKTGWVRPQYDSDQTVSGPSVPAVL